MSAYAYTHLTVTNCSARIDISGSIKYLPLPIISTLTVLLTKCFCKLKKFVGGVETGAYNYVHVL